MEIDIQPINKIDKKLLLELQRCLLKKNIKTRLLKSDNLPKVAWNKNRKQWDAVIILEKIDKKGILAITNEDIYEGGMNFIYGLADLEGSAIVSTFRLRPEFYMNKPNQNKLLARLTKECLHEIGHTLGLKHCHRMIKGKPCVMTFSTNIHEIDKKSDNFCKEDARMLE